MQEDYRDDVSSNLPVSSDRGDKSSRPRGQSGGKPPAGRQAPSDDGKPDEGDEPSGVAPHASVRWIDLVVFLSILGVATFLLTVAHLSPSSLAVFGAVVTSLYMTWVVQRPTRRRKKLGL